MKSSKYKYHLPSSAELKSLSGDWRICPSCGRKEFKPYVNIAGEPLGRECGICNRLRKCGYHVPPREYLASHPDSAPTAEVVAPKREPMKTIYMPQNWPALKMKDNDKNTLLKWLRGLPWNNKQCERLEVAIMAYAVGTDKQGRTIWWQIDGENRVRSGKMMAYKPDGHRDKAKHPEWVHSAMCTTWPADKYEYVGCLFGEHLIKCFPTAKICLVESEKSAIICSAFWPMNEKLFLATGGMHSLNQSRLAYLLSLQREMVGFPDHDGFDDWSERLKKVSNQIKISRYVENIFDESKDSPTADIADIQLRLMLERPNPDELTQQQLFDIFCIQNPHLKQLTECLELTLIRPNAIIRF